MSNTIEQGWLEIEKENGKFCCEEHRQFYRMMFFCGAMTAMQTMTGWDPAIPGVLVALGIVSMQHATQDILPTPLVALGAVSLLVLVAACAAIPALRALSRLQVADVLRAE